MQTKVLIVGCGDLGAALAQRLNQEGFSVIGLRRHLPAHPTFTYVQADVAQPDSLKILQDINPEIVVYCVAANAQTDESYRTHYVEGLRHVLDALKKVTGLKHIFFVSSTRVYGQNAGEFLDEATTPLPADFGGQRLLEAEQLLLNAAQTQSNWKATILRLTGIYGPGRIYMLRLAASPSEWPNHNVWTNRIHRVDAAAFIAHLIHMQVNGKSIEDCYVVTDSACVTQYEVLQWLADQTGNLVQQQAPEITGGKRMLNHRMLSTGFALKYPDYKAGYAALLQSL